MGKSDCFQHRGFFRNAGDTALGFRRQACGSCGEGAYQFGTIVLCHCACPPSAFLVQQNQLVGGKVFSFVCAFSGVISRCLPTRNAACASEYAFAQGSGALFNSQLSRFLIQIPAGAKRCLWRELRRSLFRRNPPVSNWKPADFLTIQVLFS